MGAWEVRGGEERWHGDAVPEEEEVRRLAGCKARRAEGDGDPENYGARLAGMQRCGVGGDSK